MAEIPDAAICGFCGRRRDQHEEMIIGGVSRVIQCPEAMKGYFVVPGAKMFRDASADAREAADG